MKRYRYRTLSCLAAFFSFVGLVQAEPAGSFTDFRLGVMGIKTSDRGGDPAAFDIHWAPVLSYEGLKVRAGIGLNIVSLEDKKQFAIFGYEVFAGQNLAPHLFLEFGGGFQNWLEHGGLTPVLSSHFLWELDQDSKLFKGMYLGGSKTFGAQSSWQGRLGLQLKIE